MEVQVKLIAILFGLVLTASTSVAQKEHLESQRQLLKEYFLYSSLKNAYGKECFDADFSGSYFVDVANYDLKAFHQLDSLSVAFVQTILHNTSEKKYPTIYLDCLEKYGSQELHLFIVNLDKYHIE